MTQAAGRPDFRNATKSAGFLVRPGNVAITFSFPSRIA